MKKLFSVLAVLFVLGTSHAFSVGIGAQGGYPLGGALTFKVDSLPCVFAVDGHFGNSGTGIGLTADWWFANPKIEGSWGYYYGLGVFGSMYFGDEWSNLNVGPRVLIGTNVFLLDGFLELYLQAAYQPTFVIQLSGENGNAGFDWFDIGAALGFRVWF